jgi:hypothetical protein
MEIRKLLSLLLIASLSSLMGCTSLTPLDTGKLNLPRGAEYHAVDKEWGWDLHKYNVTSYSDINHGTAQKKTLSSLDLRKVTTGEYEGFKWSIYATDAAYAFASHFRQPQYFLKREKTGELKKIPIPSWDQQFESLVNLIHKIIGNDAPPFNLRIDLVEDEIGNTFAKTLHSDSTIPLEFSMSVPKLKSDSWEGFDWQIDTLVVPAHEYLHTYFFYAAKQPPLNLLSNEVAAYTFQMCVELELMNSNGRLEFDAYGKPVDASHLPAPGIKSTPNVIGPDAVNESTYSVYNIVHYLGTAEIKRNDIKVTSKFFGLCSAMIHHPVDLTKEYYPKTAE